MRTIVGCVLIGLLLSAASPGGNVARGSFAALGSPQDKRSPEPPAKDQEEARKRVRELFRDEYAKKSPADVLTLAQKLLKQAQENKGDAALMFTLLREAKEKAVEAGDPTTALDAIDQTAVQFIFSAIEAKSETLDRLRKRTTTVEGLDSLLAAYLATVAEAIRNDRYEEGAKLFPGAEETAQRVDAIWLLEVKGRRRDLEAIAKEYKTVLKSIEILKQAPNDAEASLAVGKFLCFVKGEVENGLSFLAKGSDPTLKELAEKDLAKPNDDVALVALADRWYELAKKLEGGKHERRFQERAFYWYDRAWPKKTGIPRVELDKKLNEREELFRKVNLLRLVDPKQDARPLRENPKAPYEWSFKDGSLTAPVLAGMATLEIPYSFPPDYDLEITLEFVGNFGGDILFICLPSAERRCVALRGAVGETGHYIADLSTNALALPAAGEKGRLISKTPIFANGKTATILLVVRRGNLAVIWDNRMLLNCPGKFSLPKGNATLSLGSYSCSYRIHALKITPPGRRLR